MVSLERKIALGVGAVLAILLLVSVAAWSRADVSFLVGGNVLAIALLVVSALLLRRDLPRCSEAAPAQRQKREQFEDFYNNAPCGYHSLDAKGRFLDINETALTWLGYSRDEVIGRLAFTDVLTARSAARFTENFEKFKRNGTTVNVEYEWRRKDGSILPVLLNATAIYDRNGAYVASRATVFDVTQRKRAEAERDRFFTLSRDLLCIATFEGYFKRVNPAWENALGHSVPELLSRPFLEFVHPDDRTQTSEEFARLIRGEDSIEFENRYRCADGSYRWLRWSGRTAPDEKLVYASARDVTEQKEAEQRIQWLNADLALRAEQLEAANRELESFSYSVSHDLRAPLRHIDGFSGLLLKRLGESADPDVNRYVATISRAAKQMGTLIDDLLAFSRIGRAPLRLEPVNLNQLVADVIDDGRFREGAKPIQWEIGNLPDVRADPTLLRQVWANLIDNAVKYSSKVERPRIEIGGQKSPDADEYVFHVRDNGVGFDMAYADKLFGVFQRLHGPTEFEGTGIGLANVRRVISRHGGRTWAEARVNEGAAFYFSLPSPPSPRPPG